MFGYDFMIDEDARVFLIEVNTNPCLDTSPCPLLQRVVGQVLDQTFKIAVDPFLPAKDAQYASAVEMSLSELNYEMVCSNVSDNRNETIISQDYDPRARARASPFDLHLSSEKIGLGVSHQESPARVTGQYEYLNMLRPNKMMDFNDHGLP